MSREAHTTIHMARGKGQQKKDSLRCLYCQRTFARTEHLARHERSHRNEKPFQCDYCESTFARRDVVKRHCSRYHPNVLQSSTTGIPTQTTPRQVDVQVAQAWQPPSQIETMPTQVTLDTTAGFDMDTLQADLERPHPDPTFRDPMHAIDYFLCTLGNDIAGDAMLLDWTGLSGLNGQEPNTDINAAQAATRDSSTEASRLGWMGSCEISASKRNELEKEVDAFLVQNDEPTTFKFPSCLAFERLLTSCFEFFITYLPCLHIPTWKADSAHPALLLAMAALSACCNGEHEIAHIMYRVGRRAVLKHLDSGSAWAEEQPVWTAQSILILMTYGTSCGRKDSFNEALSWASLLARVVLHQKQPDLNGSESGQLTFELWKNWIDQETIVRTQCVSFVLLNNLNVCYNVAPALLNSDMKDALLPCAEKQWLAGSLEVWADARRHEQSTTLKFIDVLNNLITPSQSQIIKTSRFASHVMLHAIVQRIWRLMSDTNPSDASYGSFQVSRIALQKWQLSWEADPDCSISSRKPDGGASATASALLPLAYTRLHVDFSIVRAALSTLDVDKIAQSMQNLDIKVNRSDSSLETMTYALQSLRTRVKLGMGSRTGVVVPPHSLQMHLVSIECCLFASALIKEITSVPVDKQSPNERESVRLLEEALAEIQLDQSQARKPLWTQLIYAWASVCNCTGAWGIQRIIGEAFKTYADSVS